MDGLVDSEVKNTDRQGRTVTSASDFDESAGLGMK